MHPLSFQKSGAEQSIWGVWKQYVMIPATPGIAIARGSSRWTYRLSGLPSFEWPVA